MEEDYEDVEGEEYSSEGKIEIDDDVAPVMPNDYYENVENFLNRQPPKLKTDKKSKTKSKLDLEREIAADFNKRNVSLPIIPSKKGKSREDLPPRPTVPTAVSKVAASIQSKPAKKARDIDTNLLLEAFAYTEQLAREDIEDEQEQSNRAALRGAGHEPHPHSAPEPRKAGGKSSKAGAGRAAADGVVKRLRSRTQQTEGAADFAVGGMSEESNSAKSQLDFDALVANFQQGITLHKLQAELQSSQQSMARSEEFMRQLARDFGGMSSGGNSTSNSKPSGKSKASGHATKR